MVASLAVDVADRALLLEDVRQTGELQMHAGAQGECSSVMRWKRKPSGEGACLKTDAAALAQGRQAHR